jgi:osmotically-inducible protein OsmY
VTAPPPGAGGQDWALAQQIQSVLMSDRTLDSHVAAVVKDGVVTLHGGVSSKHERERIRQEIGSIPGVVRVDDQLGAGNPNGLGSGTTQNY